jgi:hypothetical protein
MTHAPRLVQDWLCDSGQLDPVMNHYADAVFESSSVLVNQHGSTGRVTGKAIAELYRGTLEKFPKRRVDVEEVIERPYGMVVRKEGDRHEGQTHCC